MGQLMKLPFHCLCVCLIPISKAHDGNPGPEVQVFPALRVIEPNAFPVIEYHRKTVICLV